MYTMAAASNRSSSINDGVSVSISNNNNNNDNNVAPPLPPLPPQYSTPKPVSFSDWFVANQQPLATMWASARALFDACTFEQFAEAMYSLSSKRP